METIIQIETSTIFEFFGMMFTMTGAFLITTKKFRFIGFASFLTANYIMLAFASMKGLVPLQVQMIFFFFATVPALKAYSSDWNLVKRNLIIISILYIMLMIEFLNYKPVGFTIPTIEIVAAIIAIVGSYLQKYQEKDLRILSFALFFIADVLYVAISIELGMLFFGIQSFFFWYTSVKGIKCELNNESFTDYVKEKININTERV